MLTDIRFFALIPMQGNICVDYVDDVEDPILPEVGDEFRQSDACKVWKVEKRVFGYEPIPADKGGGHKAVIHIFVR